MSTSYDLERFKEAQKTAFGIAVGELRAGRKRGHWIWYVLPQLRGLGTSQYAVQYGLDGVGEAHAYLRDSLLRERYYEVASVVHRQVVERKLQLVTLMGSHIDAQKAVSSLTLFEHAARTLQGRGSDVGLAELAALSAAVLAVAETQRYPRCAFTLEEIRKAALHSDG